MTVGAIVVCGAESPVKEDVTSEYRRYSTVKPTILHMDQIMYSLQIIFEHSQTEKSVRFLETVSFTALFKFFFPKNGALRKKNGGKYRGQDLLGNRASSKICSNKNSIFEPLFQN